MARVVEPRSCERSDAIMLFLSGDVMTGRGIDQILPHPCEPTLYESMMRSARAYVALAEAAHGRIPRRVDFTYVWGDALHILGHQRPDVRVINLETAITRSGQPAPKGINYRMSPENVAVLTAAGVQCCVLANNHVLDWGHDGLRDTLSTLAALGIRTVGAGCNALEAAAPAVLPVDHRGRVVVFAYGAMTSGIPPDWAATVRKPGVNFLPDLSAATIETITAAIHAVKQPRDVVVASIHWGSNWGYDIPSQQIEFAHALIDDGGVDIVHGHSSHHPRGIEVYRNKLILYGCGDLLNDYEGIRGHEGFRADLALMYLPTVDPGSGTLSGLTLVPLQMRHFRLNAASAADAAWLCASLNRAGRGSARVHHTPDDTLRLAWE